MGNDCCGFQFDSTQYDLDKINKQNNQDFEKWGIEPQDSRLVTKLTTGESSVLGMLRQNQTGKQKIVFKCENYQETNSNDANYDSESQSSNQLNKEKLLSQADVFAHYQQNSYIMPQFLDDQKFLKIMNSKSKFSSKTNPQSQIKIKSQLSFIEEENSEQSNSNKHSLVQDFSQTLRESILKSQDQKKKSHLMREQTFVNKKFDILSSKCKPMNYKVYDLQQNSNSFKLDSKFNQLKQNPRFIKILPDKMHKFHKKIQNLKLKKKQLEDQLSDNQINIEKRLQIKEKIQNEIVQLIQIYEFKLKQYQKQCSYILQQNKQTSI